MVIKDKEQIKDKLKELNNFQECIIEDIILSNYGTTVEIRLNYIWEDGYIRKDLDKKKLALISFKLVNEFSINNCLNDSILKDPYSLDWGFNEISAIYLKNNRDSQFNTIEILWESKRKIEITFERIEIIYPWLLISS